MTTVRVQSVKLVLPFKAGDVPQDIDPADPRIVIDLGGLTIQAKVNAKAVRKLAQHPGGAVLQGRLVRETDGTLHLLDAGFQFLEPAPPAPG